MGWNFLEHLTYLYWTDQQGNLLIDREKFDQIRIKTLELLKISLQKEKSLTLNIDRLLEQINQILNEANNKSGNPLERKILRNLKHGVKKLILSQLSDQNVMNQDFSCDNIVDLLVNKLDNFPGIRHLIYFMCDRIGKNLTPEEKETISLMYEARNICFHNTPDISVVLEELASIKKTPNEDFVLSNLLRSFKILLREIFWKLFGWQTDSFKCSDFGFTYRSFHTQDEAREFFHHLETRFIKDHKFLKLAAYLARRRNEWAVRFPPKLSGSYSAPDGPRKIQVSFNGYVPEYARGQLEMNVQSTARFIIQNPPYFNCVLVFHFSFIPESVLQLKARLNCEILEFQIDAKKRIEYIKKIDEKIAQAIEEAVNFQVTEEDDGEPLRFEIKRKSKIRSRIEALFGILRENSVFQRSRVRTLPRVTMEQTLIFTAHNLYGLVALISGRFEDHLSTRRFLWTLK